MQYKSCMKCIHHGKRCQVIMAQSMNVLSNIEYLVKYAQPRCTDTDAKCRLKVEYSCENFTPRKDEENAE